MKRKFVVRRATQDDAKAIHEVLLAAFEKYRDFYSPEAFSDTVLDEKAAKIRLEQMVVFVAIDFAGKIAGTIGWQKVNDIEGHIRGMAVRPENQGRNGPAAKLLKIIEKDAQKDGCSLLTLDTTEILQRAQNFYIKHGYRKTGKTGDFFGNIIHEFAKNL